MAAATRAYRCPECDTSHALAVPPGEIVFCPDCHASLVPARSTRSATKPLAPGNRLGRYEIVSEIARGGMGVILRAKDPKLGREVALKVLLAGEGATDEMIERLQREARAASKLRHPGIVAVHDVGVEDGHHFIAMELIDGVPLDDRDRKALGGFPGVAALLADVADAIQHAHEQGVIHRDLKPSNILMDRGGRPHVTDFGIAKDLSAKGLTAAGSVLGTPEFMAPEQAQGLRNIDARADVFALGIIGYTLATGKQPFKGRTIMESMKRVVETDPALPSRVVRNFPGDLEAVLCKALEKPRAARYQTAAELAADLRRFAAGEPVSVSRPTLMAQAVRAARRRWPVLAGAAGALVAGILVTLALVGGGDGGKAAADARKASAAAKRATAEAEREKARLEEAKREARAANLRAARAEVVRDIETRRMQLGNRHLQTKNLLGTGQYDQAIEALDAVERDLANLAAVCDEAPAEIRDALREDDEVRRALVPGPLATAVAADQAWGHALRGRNVRWFREWDYAGAIADLGRAVALDPGMPVHRKARGMVHLEARHFREAADDLAPVLPALPESDQLEVRLGLLRAYCMLGEGAKAEPLIGPLPADSVDREFYAAWLPAAKGAPGDAVVALDDFLPKGADWRGWQRKGIHAVPAVAALVRAVTADGHPDEAVRRADDAERMLDGFARMGRGQVTPEQQRGIDLQRVELWLARARALATLAATGAHDDAAPRARADCERVRKVFAAEPESAAILARLP